MMMNDIRARSALGRAGAFTILELAIVLLALAVIAALLLPALARRNIHPSRVSCINNLKQIGLGIRTWTLDNNDRLPMQVSVTNGGSMELVGSGQAWLHFLVMSNELVSPMILICPDEPSGVKIGANTFSSQPAAGSKLVVFGSDKNVSYFVGLDATNANNPQAVLTGDRGMLINGSPAKPGLVVISTNDTVAWFQPRHGSGGNIGLADGSVQTVGSPGLTTAFRASGLATNRLAMP